MVKPKKQTEMEKKLNELKKELESMEIDPFIEKIKKLKEAVGKLTT